MQGWKIVKVLIFKVVSFNFEHFFPLNNLLISLLTVQRNLNFPTIASFSLNLAAPSKELKDISQQ